MPLSEGSRIGPYQVVAPLGAGGMGEVWRARDPRLGRDVAIKVLPDDTSRDEGRVARFRAEARAASALNHPNIVAVYDIGDDAGRTYLAMELLQGVNLRCLLEGGRLPLSKALHIASQIADGLAAAHARGIVHRDLKPENVILTTDDVVKILDFGLAKASPLAASPGGEESTLSVTPGTEPGALIGTIGYMSPEQAAGHVVDFRADQFSFGTILYELVSGRRAWRKATPAETIVAILREDAPPLSSAQQPVPASVCRLVARCLAKSPDDRYSSSRDLARDVRFLAEESSGHRAPSDAGLAVPDAPAPRASRRAPRAAWALAAAAAAAALGLAVWSRLHARPGEATSLAVLPFENGTKEADSEYLSDGITESLIDQMSRVKTLRVMARATVFRFKGAADPLDAGRKLGVGAVVTGRVSRQDGRLSIAAELVDVRTGQRLWGDRYDRPAGELLHVQDKIAADISDGLRLHLTEPQKQRIRGHGTESTEAYELFLKGRFAFYKDTEEGYLESIALFRQAYEKDPRFADAFSWSANVYGTMAVDGYMPPADAFTRLEENAHQALALYPGLAAARLALMSRRLFWDWDWAGAEREFRDVLAANETTFVDFRVPAMVLWSSGRASEAVAIMQTARGADPGNLAFTVAAADYMEAAGDPKAAAALYRAAIEVDPSDPRAAFGLAEALKRQGDAAGAIAALRKGYELVDEAAGVQALAGARTESDYEAAQVQVARGRLADLEALAAQRYVSPLEIARLAAQTGDREKAFRSLDASFAERSSGLVFLKVDHAWDKVRDDPRFGALVKRVGIP